MDPAARLREGLVIPAHPLALTAGRKLDEHHQRGLTRYYLSAGVGGIAVGVHTTQFAIREPRYGLFRPVLELAAEVMRGHDVVKIAGVCGKTAQAVKEAELASSIGYDAVLLSMAALRDDSIEAMIEHARQVASVIPVIGFYLQPGVGGRILPYEFWRRFAEIPNVIAIKIAPFNRYQTLDVVRAVANSGRSREISLYTGNDDNILLDLLSNFQVGGEVLHMAGGLLGHWAVWTRKAVELLALVKQFRASGAPVPQELFALAHRITDANAAIFDPANGFRGCIPGIHEILFRQGLLATTFCLDPEEQLSPGQREEIDRVCREYPFLSDELSDGPF